MTGWEYKVIEVQFQEGDEALMESLNKEGKYGWELVSVVNLGLIRAKVFFRRIIGT